MKYGRYLNGISNLIENSRCEILNDPDINLGDKKQEIDDALVLIKIHLKSVSALIEKHEG